MTADFPAYLTAPGPPRAGAYGVAASQGVSYKKVDQINQQLRDWLNTPKDDDDAR